MRQHLRVVDSGYVQVRCEAINCLWSGDYDNEHLALHCYHIHLRETHISHRVQLRVIDGEMHARCWEGPGCPYAFSFPVHYTVGPGSWQAGVVTAIEAANQHVMRMSRMTPEHRQVASEYVRPW